MNLISGTREKKWQDKIKIKICIDLSTVCREAGYLWRKRVGGRDEFHGEIQRKPTLMGWSYDVVFPTM